MLRCCLRHFNSKSFIKPGKRLVAADSKEGRRPFIGALDNSNGVARFVSDDNVSKDKNVLGVNYNGNGIVICFYHPYECIFSDDVKRFHLKHYPDKEYVLLFMKALILKQKSKFGYLYKFNAERMAHTSIMMPVDAEGNPDYASMEQYGKMLVARKHQQYGNTHFTLVLPYLKAEYRDNENEFLDYYDEVDVCYESSIAHPKAAIKVRNRSMIGRSDLVVCCVQHNSGGAYRALQYAEIQGKRIINIPDEE